jgi:hypothetical protein
LGIRSIFFFANPNPSCKLTAVNVERIEKALSQLPREERRQFADWFYRHENEIFEPSDEDEINPAMKAEILRRGDELDANPGLAVPVSEEWFEQLKRKLADARPRQGYGGAACGQAGSRRNPAGEEVSIVGRGTAGGAAWPAIETIGILRCNAGLANFIQIVFTAVCEPVAFVGHTRGAGRDWLVALGLLAGSPI